MLRTVKRKVFVLFGTAFASFVLMPQKFVSQIRQIDERALCFLNNFVCLILNTTTNKSDIYLGRYMSIQNCNFI